MENTRIDSKHINRPHGDNIFINPLYVYEEQLRLIYFPDTAIEKQRQDLLGDVADLLVQIDQPAKVVIAGGFNAGKSTFINALLDREIMPVGPVRTTATVNCLVAGLQQEFVVFRKDGTQVTSSYLNDVDLNSAVCSLMHREHDTIERIEIACPQQILDKFTLIDTPGLEFSEEDTAATLSYVAQADAIIWLLDNRGCYLEDLEPISRFHETNPASPLIIIINKIDKLLYKDDRDSVFKTVSEGLKDITNHIFLLSAEKALAGRQNKNTSDLDDSGFNDLNHYLNNHLFNDYRDLLEQRIKQHIKQRSEVLIQSIDCFLKENADVVVARTPVKLEDINNILLSMKQKEDDLRIRIVALEVELSALKTERKQVEDTGTIITDGLPLPAIEHLLEFLPAIFNNFWGVVRPDDFAFRVGLNTPPSIPSPYSYPNADMLLELQIKFQALPIMEQLKIIAFCRSLMDIYNLELCCGMRVLHN